MRIGLLEDDVSIQEMLCLVLQDEGYHVTAFPTAEACLEALGIPGERAGTPPVDVMIIDWFLNGTINGTEVIQQIRQQPYLDALPIILTTAATITNTEELQQLNVALLEKPFAVDEILALIEEITAPRSTT